MIRQVDALAASVKEHFAKMRKLTSDISAVVGKREMATFYVWVEKNDWMLQVSLSFDADITFSCQHVVSANLFIHTLNSLSCIVDFG